MFHISHSFGSPLDHEKRLCRFSPGIKKAAEHAAELLKDSVYGFFEDISNKFKDAIGTNKETEMRLRNERQWIEAFNRPDIMDAPVDPNAIAEHPFGPADLLRSMSKEDRKVELIRFMRSIVPADVREAIYKETGSGRAKTFDNPLFRKDEKNLDDSVSTMRAARPPIPLNLSSDTIAELQRVQMHMMGEKISTPVRGDPSEKIAREVLTQRYKSGTKDPLGTQFRDLKDAVENARPPISKSDRANPAILLSRLGPSRLKAAIQFGIITPGDIGDLTVQFSQEEADKEMAAHKQRTERAKIDKSQEQGIEARNRTFMDNWRSLRGKEKFFAMALIGYATYKMLKSDKWWISSIPLLAGGVFLYQRLVMGDKRPLDSWARGARAVQDRVMNLSGVKKAFEAVGLIGEEGDRDQLLAMGRFLQKNNIPTDPSATAFYCMADAKMENLAMAFDFDVNADGSLKEKLNVDEGSPLHTDLKGVAKLHKFDREKMFAYMRTHNSQTADAMGNVFYMLGAQEEPGVAAQVEELTNGGDPELSDNVIVKSHYRDLVLRGRSIAGTKYAGKSFKDVIKDLPDKEAKSPTLDRADTVKDPLAASSRTLEKEFYKKIRTPGSFADPLKAREEILKTTLTGEAAAFLLELHRLEILDFDAIAFIGESMAEAIKDDKVPLSEILIQAEQFKYILLLESLNRNALPMNRNALEKLLGTVGTTGGFGPIASFINNYIGTVTSNFNEVKSLEDVLAVLKEKNLITTSGVRSTNGQGFPLLKEKIEIYQQRFKALNQEDKLNPTLVKLLGDGKEGRALFRALYPEDTKKITADMEKYFAQRCQNALAMTMLVTHRYDGKHTLDKLADDRYITPKEEQNLAKEFDRLFLEICGKVTGGGGKLAVAHGTEGTWEWVNVVDVNDDLTKLLLETVQLDTDAGKNSANALLNRTGRLWSLYALRNNRNESEQKLTTVTRTISIAEELVRFFNGPIKKGSLEETLLQKARDLLALMDGVYPQIEEKRKKMIVEIDTKLGKVSPAQVNIFPPQSPLILQPQPLSPPTVVTLQPQQQIILQPQGPGQTITLMPQSGNQMLILPPQPTSGQSPILQPQLGAAPVTLTPQPNQPIVLQAQPGNRPIILMPQANGQIQILPPQMNVPPPTTVLQPQPNSPPTILNPQPGGTTILTPQPGASQIILQPQQNGSFNVLPPQTAPGSHILILQPQPNQQPVTLPAQNALPLILQPQTPGQPVILQQQPNGTIQVLPAQPSPAATQAPDPLTPKPKPGPKPRPGPTPGSDSVI